MSASRDVVIFCRDETTSLLVRFWRSKVKVTAGRRGGECIHVDAGMSKSIFQFMNMKQNISYCDVMWDVMLCLLIKMHMKCVKKFTLTNNEARQVEQ